MVKELNPGLLNKCSHNHVLSHAGKRLPLWPTDVNSSNDKTDLCISWYVALSYSKIHGHIWDS